MILVPIGQVAFVYPLANEVIWCPLAFTIPKKADALTSRLFLSSPTLTPSSGHQSHHSDSLMALSTMQAASTSSLVARSLCYTTPPRHCSFSCFRVS